MNRDLALYWTIPASGFLVSLLTWLSWKGTGKAGESEARIDGGYFALVTTIPATYFFASLYAWLMQNDRGIASEVIDMTVHE